MIEAIRPAVLLCWAGAETTDGMEVISKTEHLFKGDGKCNKPSRYLLHWFHAHWTWEMPSHSLCFLKCSYSTHTPSPAVQGQAGMDICENNGLWGGWLQFLGKCLDLPWWQSQGWKDTPLPQSLGWGDISDRPLALEGSSHCFQVRQQESQKED